MVATSSIADVRYGTRHIDRIYVGSALVWQRHTGGAAVLMQTDGATAVDLEQLLGRPADADTAATVEAAVIEAISSVVDADSSASVEAESVLTSGLLFADDVAGSMEAETSAAAITDADTASSVDADALATLTTKTDADTATSADAETRTATLSATDTATSTDNASTVKTGLIVERTPKVTQVSAASSVTGDVSNAQVGDLMLCSAAVNSAPATISTGWTPVFAPTTVGTSGWGLWYRWKTGQAADVPTVSYDTSDVGSIILAAFGGVNATTPFDVAYSTNKTSSGSSIAVPSLTTVTAQALLVTGGAVDGTSETWHLSVTPTSYVEKAQTTGVGRRQALATRLLAAAGASGSATWAQSGGSIAMGGWQVALRPA